jgi:formiminoglutamase
MQHYQVPEMSFWKGRIDSNTLFDAFRWHQWVKPLNLLETTVSQLPNSALRIGFIGFCCDEGIRLNRGRSGASDGPNSIRTALSSLPCAFSQEVHLYDAGNILCDDLPLEESQASLAKAVEKLLELNCFPIVLGGGHELAYGTWSGLYNYLNTNLPEHQIKIVNFDAHFDLRPYIADADHIASGPSSGTMFRQIADVCKKDNKNFDYLCLGIQKRGNTIDLFKVANALNTEYWLAVDMVNEPLHDLSEKLEKRLEDASQLYLTLCTDVIASSFAPGVSAPQPLGLHPEMVTQLIKQLIKSGKVIAFDIAEVSPRFDHDTVTASLASTVIFAVVNELAENKGLAIEI